MKILLWSLLGLFLVGNALFVLPVNLCSDKVSSTYFNNYKKDTTLLRAVYGASPVTLQLNMAPYYQALYTLKDSATGNAQPLKVNVVISHDLAFSSVLFPFFKQAKFNSTIAFFSTIRTENALLDSTALIGSIVLNGSLSSTGICTPQHARGLAEKEIMDVLGKEMKKAATDLNARLIADTAAAVSVPQPVAEKPMPKRKKK